MANELDAVLYVPRVQRVMSLPYFESYYEYIDHRTDCARCTEAIARGSDVGDHCALGRCLVAAVQWDIDRQHDIAKLN